LTSSRLSAVNDLDLEPPADQSVQIAPGHVVSGTARPDSRKESSRDRSFQVSGSRHLTNVREFAVVAGCDVAAEEALPHGVRDTLVETRILDRLLDDEPELPLGSFAEVQGANLVKLRLEVVPDERGGVRLQVEDGPETPETGVVLTEMTSPPFLERCELRELESLNPLND